VLKNAATLRRSTSGVSQLHLLLVLVVQQLMLLLLALLSLPISTRQV
jgi:hypothetical protein